MSPSSRATMASSSARGDTMRGAFTEPSRLVQAAAVVFLILAIVLGARYAPIVSGDAVIHLVMMERSAHGDWFAFNAGAPEASSSSPLWTIVGASFIRAGGLAFGIVAMKALAFVAWLSLGVLVYALAVRLGSRRDLAMCGGALVIAMPGTASNGVQGMENGAFAALVLGAVLAASGSKKPAATFGAFVLAAVEASARPVRTIAPGLVWLLGVCLGEAYVCSMFVDTEHYRISELVYAPEERRERTDAVLSEILRGGCRPAAPAVAMMEVQQRFWWDDRLRALSLDGVTGGAHGRPASYDAEGHPRVEELLDDPDVVALWKAPEGLLGRHPDPRVSALADGSKHVEVPGWQWVSGGLMRVCPEPSSASTGRRELSSPRRSAMR